MSTKRTRFKNSILIKHEDVYTVWFSTQLKIIKEHLSEIYS